MHRSFRWLAFASGLLSLGWAVAVAPCQQPASLQAAQPASSQAMPTAASPARISIDALVTDSLGHAVRGLQQGDFKLLDKGQPVSITGFRAIDPATQPSAVHLLIVIDMINTGFTSVAWEREQLGQFLKQDGGKLSVPAGLAMMTDRGAKIMQGTTREGGELNAALEKMETDTRIIGRDAGFYGAAERLELSLSQLHQIIDSEARQPGRKLMLVLSPGWPMLPMASVQQTTRQRQWVFNALVGLTTGLREAHIALYCLDPFELGLRDPFMYKSYLKPVRRPENAEIPEIALQVLAEHSGGRVLIKGRDVLGEINAAARDATAYYQLTFDPPTPEHPNEYHDLHVSVDKADAAVLTSAGYYAEPTPVGAKTTPPSQAAQP